VAPQAKGMPIEPRFHSLHDIDPAVLAVEAAAGLREASARIAPKFFYDELGSRLFDAITELPSYYLTRIERAIFEEHRQAIADAVLASTGPAPVMIDLGAGNGEKAARWFDALLPRRYVAVDISVDYLRGSLSALQREHTAIEMVGVGQDFSAQLQLPADVATSRSLVFYPGSSIGNFAPDAALRLLRDMRVAAADGALLIGVDLVKPAALLDAAYDDDLGVTAAFNLNILLQMNRLLDADFAPHEWRHVARFDEPASRVQMHLEAKHDLRVAWRGGERAFRRGERIHTEDSHKWTREGFAALLRDAGFGRVAHWTDAQGWYAAFVAHA
jgi:L-histidine N-alpha-methyltransferase